jgi:two-component system LytT family response regulator
MSADTIRVVIADDEHLACERLSRLLAQESGIQVVGVAHGGEEAARMIVESRPALAFLDVKMPGLDGFGVVESLLASLSPDEMPIIVFITAYNEFAIKAFEARALDYLVKPFEDERFAETLNRVRSSVRKERLGALTDKLRDLLAPGSPIDRDHEEASASEDAAGRLDRIVLKTGNRARIIKAEDVDWIAADGVYARIHFDGTSALLRTPLNELETRLDPRRFVRIHRSSIVNLDRV